MEGTQERGTISYPISTEYRKNWGEWESFREIYQNAVDTGTRVKVIRNGNSVTIRDHGNGFALRNLIIGESTKDGVTSIGKFGEGMKFALLALVRDGKKVEISTGSLRIVPRIEETLGAQTLAIDWGPLPGTETKGTRVRIEGMTETYEDRILPPNQSLNFQDRILHDKPGKLFIKGLFVKEIHSKVGYNLNMERENPITGDCDDYKVKEKIGWLIRNTKDRRYIRYLVQAARDQEFVIETEWSCHVDKVEHPNVWRDVVAKEIGQCCLMTDTERSHIASYEGNEVIRTNAPFASAVFKRDVDVVAGFTRKSKPVGKRRLTANARRNVEQAETLLSEASGEKVKIDVVEFNDETKGLAQFRTSLQIAVGETESLETTMAVAMHEFVHWSTGAEDLTPEFQEEFGKIAGKVIGLLAKRINS